MTQELAQEVARLAQLSVNELRQRYAELHGEPTRMGHKAALVRRIAWRLQAQTEGDLSERARQRAGELANDADLRLFPPRALKALPIRISNDDSDPRLPSVGSLLIRKYKGQRLEVQVLAEGFQYQGTIYASLSAVARAITSSHVNGYQFFRLGRYGA
jgi:hypothetical protein